MKGACDACGRFDVEVRIDLDRCMQLCVDTVGCVEAMHGVEGRQPPAEQEQWRRDCAEQEHDP